MNNFEHAFSDDYQMSAARERGLVPDPMPGVGRGEREVPGPVSSVCGGLGPRSDIRHLRKHYLPAIPATSFGGDLSLI